MPNSKREVRASGVGRSLGASRSLETCDKCRRRVPRDAIAYISRVLLADGRPIVFCGECWYVVEPALDTYVKQAQLTRALPEDERTK